MNSHHSSRNVDTACRICGNANGNRLYYPREMFFGTRKTYEYLQCKFCETIQAVKEATPEEMYPKQYYAHKLSDLNFSKDNRGYHYGRLSRLGLSLSVWTAACGYRRLFDLIHKVKPWYCSAMPPYLVNHEKPMRVRLSSRILDVGCGNGDRLEKQFAINGFSKLAGIEPFIEKDFRRRGNFIVRKMFLNELRGEYDFIMMHHAFEHVPNPRQTLLDLNRLLADRGECLIRMPVLGAAWDKYGIDWVQLDAPRHRFIFRDRTFADLAATCGFDCREIVYDSNAFQFWGSEQYVRDIPLMDVRSRQCGCNEGFSPETIVQFAKIAKDLNKRSLGDQACFYLRKKRVVRA